MNPRSKPNSRVQNEQFRQVQSRTNYYEGTSQGDISPTKSNRSKARHPSTKVIQVGQKIQGVIDLCNAEQGENTEEFQQIARAEKNILDILLGLQLGNTNAMGNSAHGGSNVQGNSMANFGRETQKSAQPFAATNQQPSQGGVKANLSPNMRNHLGDDAIEMIEEIQRKALMQIDSLRRERAELIRRLNEQISLHNDENKRRVWCENELRRLIAFLQGQGFAIGQIQYPEWYNQSSVEKGVQNQYVHQSGVNINTSQLQHSGGFGQPGQSRLISQQGQQGQQQQGHQQRLSLEQNSPSFASNQNEHSNSQVMNSQIQQQNQNSANPQQGNQQFGNQQFGNQQQNNQSNNQQQQQNLQNQQGSYSVGNQQTSQPIYTVGSQQQQTNSESGHNFGGQQQQSQGQQASYIVGGNQNQASYIVGGHNQQQGRNSQLGQTGYGSQSGYPQQVQSTYHIGGGHGQQMSNNNAYSQQQQGQDNYQPRPYYDPTYHGSYKPQFSGSANQNYNSSQNQPLQQIDQNDRFGHLRTQLEQLRQENQNLRHNVQYLDNPGDFTALQQRLQNAQVMGRGYEAELQRWLVSGGAQRGEYPPGFAELLAETERIRQETIKLLRMRQTQQQRGQQQYANQENYRSPQQNHNRRSRKHAGKHSFETNALSPKSEYEQMLEQMKRITKG